jgi:hypothetical protein
MTVGVVRRAKRNSRRGMNGSARPKSIRQVRRNARLKAERKTRSRRLKAHGRG